MRSARRDADEAAVRQFALDNAPAYAHPSQIIFLAQPFPYQHLQGRQGRLDATGAGRYSAKREKRAYGAFVIDARPRGALHAMALDTPAD